MYSVGSLVFGMKAGRGGWTVTEYEAVRRKRDNVLVWRKKRPIATGQGIGNVLRAASKAAPYVVIESDVLAHGNPCSWLGAIQLTNAYPIIPPIAPTPDPLPIPDPIPEPEPDPLPDLPGPSPADLDSEYGDWLDGLGNPNDPLYDPATPPH